MECRLSSAPAPDTPWSCQISIRWEFDEAGRPLDNVREDKFGPKLTDKTEVEVMLRRAQAAVLSPSIPSEHFVRADLAALVDGRGGLLGGRTVGGFGTLLFSKNVIVVDVVGPELVDLSFVDLPGKCLVGVILASAAYSCVLR